MAIRRTSWLTWLGCALFAPLLASCSGSSGGGADASTDTGEPDVKGHDAKKDHEKGETSSDLATLTVMVPDMQGSVVSDDHQIYCGYPTAKGASCIGHYPLGATVNLTEARSIAYLFTGWGGACAFAGTQTTCSIPSISGNTTVSVAYEIPPLVDLKVVITGGSGKNTVNSNPMGIMTGGSETAQFPEGTGITLTAVPGPSQSFSKWVGGQCGTGTMASMSTCSFGLGGADTETATFTNCTYPPCP